MRLLHFNDSGSLVLSNFAGKTVPPYAVLSHRWGDSEVLFEDLGNDANTYEKKEGYRKIEFCAKQAAQDQLNYFWIDTCCIDKWNRRERSRAINSMFRWYADAARCYVLLSDVLVHTSTDVHDQSIWEASFRASKWFSRGWTLQEMIAPSSVEFFSSEGWKIGDKHSLEHLIHETTRIPVEALQNYPLDEFSALERIAWASNRDTTEGEDNAYCLLGILGISIPTSYGEGKEKAFNRLQAELQATSSIPSIIPFSQNDKFVGREPQLAELEAKLLGDMQTTMIAITGPGGTGKSQLALELAYRIRQKNKSCSVFWIDASDKDSFYQAYSSIAQKLDIPGWDDDNSDAKQLVKLHLSRSTRQWLLIYDNIDDFIRGPTELSTARATDLINCLPQSEAGSIVFTTANDNITETLAIENTVELRGMTPEAAQLMLDDYLNPLATSSDQQEAAHLLKELSYMPLAIIHAAAYLKNTGGATVQNYRSQLIEKKEYAIEISSELLEDKLQDYGEASPVAATLLISLDHILKKFRMAAECLFLSACVDRKDIPFDFLGTTSEREEALRVLSDYALVTRRPADSSIDLHRLVHLSLRKQLEKWELLSEWTLHAITRLLEVFPDDSRSRSKWRRLLPHAKYALSCELTDPEDTDKVLLMDRCIKALYNDGRWKEAEELEVQVIEVRKRLLGEEHKYTLASIGNLAYAYNMQGRWKDAEELEVRVVEIRKRVLGDEHQHTLTSMGNLAVTYSTQGRWKEAEELEVQLIELRKRVLGDEHEHTLASMGNLAFAYRMQGRWEDAETLDMQVLETSKRVLGHEHLDTLTSMGNLALVYKNQERWKEAKELELQVMEMRRRILGDEHPDTLTSMANLATTFGIQEQWKDAEELEVQVIEIRKRVLGEEHQHTLTSMGNLAVTYGTQGRWKDAEELDVRVMETRKRVLGDEHPETLASMANLATTYRKQCRNDEAIILLAECAKLQEKVFGRNHPDTEDSLVTLHRWQMKE